jgi:membrane dipeptidase
MRMRRISLWGLLLVARAAGAEGGRVDLHLHVTMDRAAKPVFRGEPGRGPLSDGSGTRLFNQVDLQGLRDNHLQLALAAMWPPLSVRPGRDALGESLHQLLELHRFVRDTPDFGLALTPADARRLRGEGRIALLPALEGGEGIGEVDDVDRLWRAGVRAVTLVHFADSDLGGAAAGQVATNFFGMQTHSHNPEGLSALGKAAVHRLVELGIVVDLAHASDATARDALDILEAAQVPAIVSHAGARELTAAERNLSDALATRVVKGGGMLGVPLYEQQLAHVPPAARFDGMVGGTCDDVVAHWLHFTRLVDPAAVALGSDFNGFIVRPRAGGSCPHGLRRSDDLGDLYAALEKHGVPKAALDGSWERFLGVWQVVQSHASKQAQAHALKVPDKRYDLFDSP